MVWERNKRYMKLRIFGCRGGISGYLRTTSMLLDNGILIDAGTGVGAVCLRQLTRVNHVFVSHSHLDPIGLHPFLVDTVEWMRNKPITGHAMHLRYQGIFVGITVDLNGRRITPPSANHAVPAVGFYLNSGKGSMLFTGDTATNDNFWEHGKANHKFVISDNQNRFMQTRVRLGHRFQTSVSKHAGGGTSKTEAPDANVHYPS